MEKPYKLSFVAGGLLVAETAAIAKRFIQTQDWGRIQEEVASGALLQATRASSRSRYFLEIRRRFRAAQAVEPAFLAGELEAARPCGFALCCRYYSFLGDFVVEVLRPKLELGDTSLRLGDYNNFFERKAEDRLELSSLSETTKTKVRTVLFRMLSEAGLYDRRRSAIQLVRPPESLVSAYRRAGDSDALAHLLVDLGGTHG